MKLDGGHNEYSSIWISLAGLLTILVLYEFWFRNTYAYRTLKNMPSPPRLPLIGNAHEVIRLDSTQIVRRALEILHSYGETVYGQLGNKFIVFLTNPSDIEIVLSSEAHLEKSEEYRFFKPWFGDGLLISKGAHWRHHRKMIAPTFHQSILKSFVPKFAKHAQHVVQQLENLVGQEFNVHDHMSQVTVEILLNTVMGVKHLPAGKMCFDYAKSVVEMCAIIHRRQVKFFYRLDALYRMTKLSKVGDRLLAKIFALTKRVIDDRRQSFNWATDGVTDDQLDLVRIRLERNTKPQLGLRDDLDELDENDVGSKHRLALLDAMVEMSANPEMQWTEKDIIDEVNTIMFEGHDTTSASSSFVLCLLGIHQDVQTKVYTEQETIFGNDMQRGCSFADTLQMNYLERVIKETLRLYPPVPVIARKVNEDVKLISGPYIIPAGTTVVLSQYAVHRRADIYERPNEFDPDNFLPEKVSKRHYYSYIPFSAGPRSCVGRKYAMLMLKVLLSTLLRRYTVHCNMKESEFKLQGDIILKLADGFKITLEPRLN